MLTWSFFFFTFESFIGLLDILMLKVSILIYTVYIYVFFHWLCCIAERPNKDTPWE